MFSKFYQYFAEQPPEISSAPPTKQLLEAACSGNLSVLTSLLAAGVDIGTVNESGNKPIHVAAYEGHMHILKALLDAGANVNDLGRGNNTALHFACRNNHAEVVAFLLAHGADALAQNWRGLEASQVTENKEVRRIIFEFSQGAKLTPTAASASSAPLAMQAPPELPVPSSEGFSEPLFLPGRISRQAVPAARAPDVTTEAAAAPMAAITPEDATSGPAAPQSSEEVDSISARTATLAVASVIDALVASAEAQDATSPQ